IRAEDRFYELSEQVSDLGFENPDTLDPIVSDLGLEVTTLSGVTHDGGTGIAANPLIIDAAFSERVLDQRENSDLIELSSDSRIILRVEDYRAAELHPLAEVSDSIAALLKLEAAEQLAAEQGEALLARAQSGESLESLAAESGAEYHAAESYRRTAALPLVLRDALFVAPQPTPEQVTYRGVALDDGSFALFALTDVVPGSTDNLGAPDAIANQSGIGDLSAYVSQLRDDASVVLRPELLQ
ncbi:MAG: hypothetical protein OEQ74_01735, partial [Gammaproteobacteria bacterium]|nr:hypothetical protein [Gammaproteobacteria bacterium]